MAWEVCFDDLASHAYQIWKNATDADPSLAAMIESLPDVVYATKAHAPAPGQPNGVLVYTRTPAGQRCTRLDGQQR